MTGPLESELALISRAPPQQRPSSRLPSWVNRKTGRRSCRLTRRASVREAAHGILFHALTLPALTCLTRPATQGLVVSGAGWADRTGTSASGVKEAMIAIFSIFYSSFAGTIGTLQNFLALCRHGWVRPGAFGVRRYSASLAFFATAQGPPGQSKRKDKEAERHRTRNAPQPQQADAGSASHAGRSRPRRPRGRPSSERSRPSVPPRRRAARTPWCRPGSPAAATSAR